GQAGRVAVHSDIAPETPFDGKQEFDAARARAHDADARASLRGQHALAQGLEAGEETVDRLDRYRVTGSTGNVADIGRRPDVDRDEIVGHRRAVAANDAAVRKIKPDRLVAIEAGAGEAGKRPGVDMRV